MLLFLSELLAPHIRHASANVPGQEYCSNSRAASMAFSRCSSGSQVCSSLGYPFHWTAYSSLPPTTRLPVIFSTSYSVVLSSRTVGVAFVPRLPAIASVGTSGDDTLPRAIKSLQPVALATPPLPCGMYGANHGLFRTISGKPAQAACSGV